MRRGEGGRRGVGEEGKVRGVDGVIGCFGSVFSYLGGGEGE